MLVIDESLEITVSSSLQVPYMEEDILYFDIETTGFSPANTQVYLIGVAYYQDHQYHIKQWFADSKESEPDILTAFLEFLHGFRALVHYNGTGFDIPYIIKRCHMLHIPCDFGNIDSIDIYKSIAPLKNLFKLPALKQKNIEEFLGVSRQDCYQGGELIQIYHQFLQTKDAGSQKLLLLHNHDDVLGMLQILPITNYTCLIQGAYHLVSMKLEEDCSNTGLPVKELYLELALDSFLPKRISFGNNYFYCVASANTARLSIKVFQDELKYFYPNYKDYYYLPMEDRSIHKSVAFYVDKEFRTKAKAANCYSKKTGTFLPQFEEVISPYFKIDYYDKITYFEYTEEFTQNTDAISNYLNHIFKTLLR